MTNNALYKLETKSRIFLHRELIARHHNLLRIKTEAERPLFASVPNLATRLT